MKVKFLQIGDYVNYRGQIIKVTSLYDKGDSNEVGWSDKECVWVNADNVEPIPLTPEILEKNGFKQIGEKFICGEIDDDLIEIIPSINNTYRITVSVTDLMISCSIWCSHVHQLQHVLRLYGIEKTIEL